VLLLFGGGLALAGAFGATGLSESIGQAVSGLEGIHHAWLILLVAVVIVLLTELTSNTATAAAFLPVMGAVAVGAGVDPMLMCVPVTLAASMAFLMPVATPPNAIVFAYERLGIRDMIRAGVGLAPVAIALILLAVWFLGPPALGISR
jgi:sodium-dependent dicarboxylate transporter 2/3/5